MTVSRGVNNIILFPLTGTKADLKALNLYNSYLTDGAQNYTQKNDDEIIHTIILKKAKTTTAPTDESKPDDQVIIQFGAPDPVSLFFVFIFIYSTTNMNRY